MSRIDIRLAQPDDRLKLVELMRRASLATKDEDVIRQLLAQPEVMDLDAEMIAANEVFVAEIAGRIVGFATIITREGNDAELEGLFVDPPDWRKGIATQLMRAIEREAAAWGANRLHVLANVEVLGFYRAAGFTAIGEKKTDFGPMAKLMVKPVLPL
jgi:N-acetylglutamate synthase-like GNAT family acetyltransferase